MTKETQLIAIAAACGWKDISHSEFKRPLGDAPVWHHGKIISYVADRLLPDYLNDLNAMHEAEKVIPDKDLELYRTNLNKVACALGGCPSRECMFTISATASQRAEAFSKTLGLCNDDL